MCSTRRRLWALRNLRSAGALRIEDHDRERSRPAFEAAILDDLDWLGFRPDVFPTAAFRAGRCDSRQSDREPHYQGGRRPAAGSGLVYGCVCSRSDFVGDHRSPAGESVYSGRCRGRAWSSRAASVACPDRSGPGTVRGSRAWSQVQEPALQSGDVLIRARRGTGPISSRSRWTTAAGDRFGRPRHRPSHRPDAIASRPVLGRTAPPRVSAPPPDSVKSSTRQAEQVRR